MLRSSASHPKDPTCGLKGASLGRSLLDELLPSEFPHYFPSDG